MKTTSVISTKLIKTSESTEPEMSEIILSAVYIIFKSSAGDK